MTVLPYRWTLILVLALQADLLKAQLVDQGKELFTNKDQTFIIGFPAQPLRSATSGHNLLYLTADEYAEAYIQVPSVSKNQFARLQPGGTMVVTLNGDVRMPSKTGIKTKSGIRIWANASISVYGVDIVTESSGGFLALPLSFSMLGNEYMVMTYTPVMNSIVMVTAALSGTEVTFHLKLSLPGTVTVQGKAYKNGDSFNVSLNALDSFQLLANGPAGSLSGTRIKSNKVISVYSGNDCAYVPVDKSGCDHLVEQMPPISTWGNTFIVKATPYRMAGDFFHILASQDKTIVRIELRNGTLTNTIDAGEVYVFDALPGSSHVIITSKPSLVVQYGKSHKVDNSKFAPFMSIVPPINQWSNDYTLVVPSGLGRNFRCYANIFASQKEKLSIQVHPKSISSALQSSWSDVPVSLYSTATVNLTSGQYRFYHKSPLKFFSVLFICNADFEAFGFPAGLRLVQRSPSCTIRPMVPGDRKDNDCDDRVDEELLNGIDDDGDGKIDEDLATPIPVMKAPNQVNTSECYVPHISRLRMANTPQYQALGMCNVRGDNKIFYRDVDLSSSDCWRHKNRTWTFTDGCLNTIQLKQAVTIYIERQLYVIFPHSLEIPVSCLRCSPSSKFGKRPTVKTICTGSVSISYSDSSWDVCRKCGYIDIVKVYRTWVVSNACSKRTSIQTLRFKNNGYKPWVTVAPQSLVSATNKNLTIRCSAGGDPDPQVTWVLPSGHVLNKTNSVVEIEVLDDLTQRTRVKAVLEDNSLLISDTRPQDAGVYQCVSRNIIGNASAASNITVHEDIIDVDATITLKDMEYTSDLEDPESEMASLLTRNIKKELTKVFINITGFQEVKILGYSNGSVKVLFRVVVKKQNKDVNPLVVVKRVGQHLAVSVKTGKLGDFNVVPIVKLREKPPPPDKIKASEIKESEVHVEWVPPDLHAMFGISGYMLQYKRFGLQTWKTYDTVKGDNYRIDGLEPGTAYQIRTKAQNKYGHSEPSRSLEITTLDNGLSGALIALIIIIPILVIAICAVAVWCVYKKRRKTTALKHAGSEHLLDNGVVRYTRPEEKIHINENHKWKELSRDSLELGRVLGEGQFGLVIEGKLTQEDGSTIRCAVKKLKRSATESDMKDLLNELDIMMQVGSHPNIVNLIGACAFGGPIMVVVEFCANGNLLRYLQKQSSRTYQDMAEYELHIVPKERLKIASEVANGMAHLARRRCVHRDLAARNVLLDESWTAKVSDFGLSRDVYTDSVYEKTTGGKLPAKWMAIEALEAGLNTTQSDVWSFGILLWEIETGGCIPYPAFSAMEMLAAVKQGYRLEKPTSCSIAVYNIMLRCWEADPSVRPSFDDLYADLHQLREATPSSPSYYENINDDDLQTETYA